MLRGSVPSTNSSAQHTFALAPQVSPPRSSFNRTHTKKMAFDAGFLVPCLVDEMLPGDTFNLKMHAFLRMSTPIFPIMDNLHFETFFFFVPTRLVWDHWEHFNGFQQNPGDSTDYLIPTVSMPDPGGVVLGSLADTFGIPTDAPGLVVNALPFRCYNLIWNNWFRDENLQNSAHVDFDDGPDTLSDYFLRRRGKRHDYFTSCLPWPQKGPDVMLPLGNFAPVASNNQQVTGHTVADLTDRAVVVGGHVAGNTLFQLAGYSGGTPSGFAFGDTTGLWTDLSSATGATINDLRLAFQTQKLYERDARGGTRYTEIIRSHFGVISPDMRLQRPEYIGGGYAPVVVNPVAQTTQASVPTSKDGLGNLGAYAVCAPSGHGFTYSATEHGYIIGLCSVRADVNYQQGLDRMWSRRTRLDFYWPALAHIGEQAVLNKEIYAQGTNAPFVDEQAFGFQERYAEYRYKPSVITGHFRSNAPQSLDPWHLAQDFGSLPTLSSQFIEEDPPMSRILAVPSEPHFLFDGFFSYKCARRMPVYGIPGFVDRF